MLHFSKWFTHRIEVNKILGSCYGLWHSKKHNVLRRLKKRKNFDEKLFKKFSNIQLSLDYKKKKSQFMIKNDFTKKTVSKYVKNILKRI